MLAPVRVLHLPDPAELAADRFGPVRAEELLAVGAATPLAELVAEVLETSSPTVSASPTSSPSEPAAHRAHAV
jgi:hypothetical protein